jgi:hypothetical protein
MLRIVSIVIAFLGWAAALWAQPDPPTRWTRISGGDSTEEARSIVQTADNGYAVAGFTASAGAGGTDFHLVRLDSLGRVTWSRNYGGTGDDYAAVVRVAIDGGLVMAGSGHIASDTITHGYLVKTSAAGVTSWSRLFTGTSSEALLDMQLLSGGGMIMTGWSISAGNRRVLLRRTDDQGNQTWSRTISRSDSDAGCSVQQIPEGFILAGQTRMSNRDLYLIKTNAQGTNLWTRVIGGGGDETACVVRADSGRGYWIAGSRSASLAENIRPWLMRTNAEGYLQWSRVYGDSWLSGSFFALEVLPGGDLVASGELDNHFYLVRLDSAGGVRWEQAYDETGSRTGAALSMKPTRDGGYVMAGYTSGVGAQQFDFYMMKTGRDDYSAAAEPRWTALPESPRLTAYPNPFNPSVMLRFTLERAAHVELAVFDLTGRQLAVLARGMRERGEQSVVWNAGALPSGLYLARLHADDRTTTQKLLLLK